MSTEEHLLEFHAAMRDFSIMFPGVSPERIEQVLRQHDGDVAKTIDHLLRETQPPPPAPPTYEEAITPPQRSPAQLSSAPFVPSPMNRRSVLPPPSSAPPHYTQQPFFSTEPNTSSPVRQSEAAAAIRRREYRSSVDSLSAEKRRLQLLKRENERRLDRVTDEKEARILEDEQMALLLQSRELAKAQREPRSASVAAPPRRRSSSKRSGPRVPEGPVVDEVIINSDDLRDKIRKLSKASRARLVNLASRLRSGSSENVC